MKHTTKRLLILAITLASSSPSLFAAQAQMHMKTFEQEVKEKHDATLENSKVQTDSHELIGLKNPDNRCFLNASLQAILRSSALRQYLQKNQYPNDSFGESLKLFFENYNKNAHDDAIEDATDSSEIKNALIKLHEEGIFNLDLSTNRQEDTAEVLAKILEKGTLDPAHPATNPFCLQEIAQFQCTVCKDTYEKEYDEYKYSTIISLPIQKDTLEACLWDYFYGPVEKHCDCQNSFKNCTFTKKVTLKQAPAMLCIAFNRFTETFDGHVKEFKNVSFPEENLDMRAFTEQEDQDAIYDLVACVVHKGLYLHSGHYIAYVKQHGQWYICDDALITPYARGFGVAETFYSACYNQVPYLLFYEKRSAPAIDSNLKKRPQVDKKSKSSAVSTESLSVRLNKFFFSTPQRSLLSLGFFVGAFIIIKNLFMKPHG